jgi:hypothetical protein
VTTMGPPHCRGSEHASHTMQEAPLITPRGPQDRSALSTRSRPWHSAPLQVLCSVRFGCPVSSQFSIHWAQTHRPPARAPACQCWGGDVACMHHLRRDSCDQSGRPLPSGWGAGWARQIERQRCTPGYSSFWLLGLDARVLKHQMPGQAAYCRAKLLIAEPSCLLQSQAASLARRTPHGGRFEDRFALDESCV